MEKIKLWAKGNLGEMGMGENVKWGKWERGEMGMEQTRNGWGKMERGMESHGNGTKWKWGKLK